MITQDDTHVFITQKILKTKIAEFKVGFLVMYPTPEGMTENEHIDKWGLWQYIGAYESGKKVLARDAAVVDGTIFDET